MVIQSPNAKNQTGAFASTNLSIEQQNKTGNKKLSKSQNGATSVNGSQILNPLSGQDKAKKKKEAAQSQAMQIVKDAYHNVQDMKDSRTEAMAENEDLRAKNKELQKTVSEYNAQRDELLKNAGSDDEKNQIMMSFSSRTGELEKQIQENESAIIGNNAASRETKMALLKSQDMYKANQQAEDINEAASDTLVGDLFKDAMQEMEEKRKEEEEKAKEKAEEKAAEEERIEKAKEEADKAMPTEDKVSADSTSQTSQTDDYTMISEDIQDNVNKDLMKILDDSSLLPEDLKGIVVDQIK